MKNRLAIYTAIYGNTDNLIEPPIVPDNCDFFCFTDRKDISSKVFKVIYRKAIFPNDSNRSAKYFKVFPNELFPDYEYSFWIDARTYVLAPNIFDIALELLKDKNLAVFKHPERNSIYDEANICIEWKKDAPEIINKQMDRYKQEGYKDQIVLVNGGFIFRRHHEQDIILFEKKWWEEIIKYSKRDQLSFPYAAWKTNLKFEIIYKNIYDNDLVKVLNYKERNFQKEIKGSIGNNKIVVYSALFGDIDMYKEVEFDIPGCDFVLFTDNKKLKLKRTQVRHFKVNSQDNRKAARMFKLLPHRFFPEYEYSIWIDASIIIKSDKLNRLVIEVLKDFNFAAFEHRDRKTLLEELNSCLERKKDNPYMLIKQYEDYIKEGFQDVGLIETGTLIRRHMSKEIIEFNELWWEQIKKYTIRDQISFAYVLWKKNLQFYKMSGSVWKNKYFEVQQHNIKSDSFRAKEVRVRFTSEILNYLSWFKNYVNSKFKKDV